MTRLLVLFAALILYVAPPVAQAFATSHVRPPVTALVQPTSADTEGTSGTDTENRRGTFGKFLSDNHEAFRTYGLILGAAFGLGFAVWRARIANQQAMASRRQAHAAYEHAQAANEQARAANEQARIAEQGHITDRFSAAVEHLGSKELPIRLGGIYALWRLIKDSQERDVISVIDILCAFVRHPPHPDANKDGQTAVAETDEVGSTNKIRPDVQTVVSLIGKEETVYRALLPAGYSLDLTGADLTDARLWNADLTGANLDDANLTRARLMGANLTDADLSVANLFDADLARANLTGANLTHANLTVTNITQEQLDSACITERDKPPTLSRGLKPPHKFCVP